jgi:cytochrome c-type biogenesis protein CcmH
MINKFILIKSIMFFLIIVANFSNNNSYAVEPDEMLKNKEHELLAREISKNIRCMVCQNESIDDSNAPLAKDLRILIRNKITEGNDSKEIYKFLTDRYGDFILLKPPLKIETFILWFFPFLLFLIGVYFIYWQNKKSNNL